MGIASAIIGGAAIGGIGSLLAGKEESKGAEQAAQIQANAAGNATNTQLQMYNQNRQDFLPYMRSGYGAIGPLTSSMPGADRLSYLSNFLNDLSLENRDKFLGYSAGTRSAFQNSLKDLGQLGQTAWDVSERDLNKLDTMAKGIDNFNWEQIYQKYLPESRDIQQYGQGLLDKIGNISGQISEIDQSRFGRASNLADQLENLDKNFKLEDSPIYQAQKAEISREIANKMSAGGGINSSRFEDTMTRNIAPLITGEYNRQYGRLSDLYGLQRSMAEGDYSREYGRLSDLYGREGQIGQSRYNTRLSDFERRLGLAGQQSQSLVENYARSAGMSQQRLGSLSDLYNRQSSLAQADYGSAVDDYYRRLGATGDYTASIGNQYSTEYNRLMDLAKLGLGATGTIGSFGQATAGAIGQNAITAGNAQAQGVYNSAQSQAGMYSNLGALPLEAYGQYRLYDYLDKMGKKKN